MIRIVAIKFNCWCWIVAMWPPIQNAHTHQPTYKRWSKLHQKMKEKEMKKQQWNEQQANQVSHTDT